MDTTEEYVNKYWSQVNKRKNIEKNTIDQTDKINKLLTRINLLEKKDIEGKIINMNSAYYIIETDIGVFSVHKSQLKNLEFNKQYINRNCVFNIFYNRNKYDGINLYIKYEL